MERRMMMIKKWIITGDTHGGVSTITRISNIKRNNPGFEDGELGVIILGDAGLNFYLNKTDKKYKKMLNSMGVKIYCVRGNHEQRPELIETMHLENDFQVGNMTWMEEEFPNIRYFVDGGNYIIDGHPTLVIGGAYSVDKYWRLIRAGYSATDGAIADPKKCGWFKDECLTQEEMTAIQESNAGKKFDFVLSHTCPYSWQPTDLFLGCIDQSTVDNSMEIWMDELKETFDWNIWLFGHFHADRVERPHVEQMYMDYELLDTIWNRWNGEKTFNKEWWLPKSPAMEMLELEGTEFNG
jgi:3-oxoacid CoA-transferase subunit A